MAGSLAPRSTSSARAAFRCVEAYDVLFVTSLRLINHDARTSVL
jgi:hypothetical protein